MGIKYSIAAYLRDHGWKTICLLPIDADKKLAEHIVLDVYFYLDEASDAVLMDEETGEILYSAADD